MAKARSKRFKSIVWTVATVLVAAVAFLVSLSLSEPDTDPGSDVVSPGIQQLSDQEQSALLYDQALDELESGDTSAAVETLQKAVDLDPGNTDATDQLQQLTETDPETDPDGGGGDDDGSGDTPEDDVWLDATPEVTALVPDSLPLYQAGSVAADDVSANLPFSPMLTSPDFGRITRILLSVNDLGSVDDAAGFVERVSKVAYPESGETITVDGVTAYFGTDGGRLATVSFVRGRYAFEVIVTSDVAPEEIKQQAIDAAALFPDTPPE